MSLSRSFTAFAKALTFHGAVDLSPEAAARTIALVRQDLNNSDAAERLVQRALKQHGSEDLAREAIKANDFPLFKAAVERFVGFGTRDHWFDEAFKHAFKNTNTPSRGLGFYDLIKADPRFKDHATHALTEALEHQVSQCFLLSGEAEPSGLSPLVSAFFQRFSHLFRVRFVEYYGAIYPTRKETIARTLMRDASHRELEIINNKELFEYCANLFAQENGEESRADCLSFFAGNENTTQARFDLLIDLLKPETFSQETKDDQGRDIVCAVLERGWVTTADRLARAGLLSEDAALDMYREHKDGDTVDTMPQVSLAFLQQRIEHDFVQQRARALNAAKQGGQRPVIGRDVI